MLKVAYQLGVQAAFDEVNVDALVKEAGKEGLLRRAWQGLKGLSPAKKTMIGAGTGLAGLGAGLALYPREEEQSTLSRVGDTAKSLLGNPQLMGGLTQMLARGAGGGAMGLTPGDESGTFPPPPEGTYPASAGVPSNYRRM